MTARPGPEAPPEAPGDPIAAVTHPDPYPFYANLLGRRPLYRDAAGLWVASSAAAVSAVLTSERCRVRPPAEPVPRALVGTAAGEVFRQLVRVNDGAGHCPFKQAVSAALDGLDPRRAAAEAAARADDLAAELLPAAEADGLQRFAFELPARVVGSLLGLPSAALPQVAGGTGDFVRGIAPGSDAEAVACGALAAERLFELFRSRLAERAAPPAEAGLLTALADAARRVGRPDPDTIVANGIGFLSQSYDATAGLIGNALIALAEQPGLLDEVARQPARLGDAIREVLRHDPPVQNTRRFVAEDGLVAGAAMSAGDAILVVLAAASRDPAANADPARFDLDRERRRTFGFGEGAHRCPGELLAATIAESGVAALLARGLDPRRLARPWRYRPSVNARIPSLSLAARGGCP